MAYNAISKEHAYSGPEISSCNDKTPFQRILDERKQRDRIMLRSWHNYIRMLCEGVLLCLEIGSNFTAIAFRACLISRVDVKNVSRLPLPDKLTMIYG